MTAALEIRGRRVFVPDVPAIAKQLPAWATADIQMRAQHGPYEDVPWLLLNVDADAMYAAWLAELRHHYEHEVPPRAWFVPQSMDLLPEWKQTLAELLRPDVTAYWMEVAYQCGKLELQTIVGRLQFEIRVHGGRAKYQQRSAPQGRPTQFAAGSYSGHGNEQVKGTEARQHFKRLRGTIPGTSR